jgi:hypothetical protein
MISEFVCSGIFNPSLLTVHYNDEAMRRARTTISIYLNGGLGLASLWREQKQDVIPTRAGSSCPLTCLNQLSIGYGSSYFTHYM